MKKNTATLEFAEKTLELAERLFNPHVAQMIHGQFSSMDLIENDHDSIPEQDWQGMAGMWERMANKEEQLRGQVEAELEEAKEEVYALRLVLKSFLIGS